MKRRKLFGKVENNSRRKLFSNTRRKLFNDVEVVGPEVPDGADVARVIPNPEDKQYKDVKCMDCGFVYPYEGSALNLVCPNCGSDRFEFVENISSEDELDSNIPTVDEGNPINKAFSDKRRKLFNEDGISDKPLPVNPSGSLTSLNPGPTKESKNYICPDCAARFDSEEQYVDGITCPICGSNRCRLINTVNENFTTLEENMFSDYEDDALDELLAKHKGKSVSKEVIESELHEKEIYDEVGGVKGLVESGYVTEDGDEVRFSDISDLQRKMFSKLVISVTKEFDIDPVTDRESLINSLSERLPEKSIMILRKSHGVLPEAVNFSDTSYLKDSGISDDLRVGYGGSTISLKDFMKLLSEEYPDAPDDIVDLLEEDKAIKVNGGKVLISK